MTNATHYEDMDDETYFADPAIDQSQLKQFLRNPAEWGYGRLNPGTHTDTSAMRFGTAFHAYIMGTAPVVALPEGETFTKKANREWRDEQLESGAIIVSWDDMQKLERMKQNLIDDTPELYDLIADGWCENTIFWTDRKTGLRLKAKPDLIPRGTDYIVDFKTAQSASADDFHREAIKYGYHIQALFYRQAVSMTDPNLFERTARMPKACQFWVFEKTGACDWQPFTISRDNPIEDMAKNALRQALNGIAAMREKGEREGLGEGVDAAARYAVRHGYPKQPTEIEFDAGDLYRAERFAVGASA